ncbi:MAG: Cytochrome c biogenesis protein transmembrane region [Parcubacteria group bacterium GW2011_GWF2_43_11]|nr:MAG: Cytochrome c biogenesis protein transmembrane region [Parcubacteria group bacterium GW2011_GWF2_43_11]
MEVLIGASLIVAFIAGLAALFAPCCITVLLPAYLGSIFRQKRTVFLMTFIFFLGLLSVFLPLGLGAAGLGQLFKEYHDPIFVIGGLFLLFLGATILLGIHFSLPFSISRGIKVGGAGSVFVLGIFSGFATLCCAPVLAGVIALSVLPGSLFWGGLYSLAYVLGMAIPLFVIAFFIDKTNITERLGIFKKQISYSLAGKQINLTVANIVSGITFFLMGALILYLAETGQLAMGGGEYQITINVYLAKLTYFVNQYLGQIPAIVWVIIIVAVLLLIIKMVLKRKIIS